MQGSYPMRPPALVSELGSSSVPVVWVVIGCTTGVSPVHTST